MIDSAIMFILKKDWKKKGDKPACIKYLDESGIQFHLNP